MNHCQYNTIQYVITNHISVVRPSIAIYIYILIYILTYLFIVPLLYSSSGPASESSDIDTMPPRNGDISAEYSRGYSGH